MTDKALIDSAFRILTLGRVGFSGRQVEGLYLENDRVVGDTLEDWNLFWQPIKQALSHLWSQ